MFLRRSAARRDELELRRARVRERGTATAAAAKPMTRSRETRARGEGSKTARDGAGLVCARVRAFWKNDKSRAFQNCSRRGKYLSGGDASPFATKKCVADAGALCEPGATPVDLSSFATIASPICFARSRKIASRDNLRDMNPLGLGIG